MDVKCKFSMNQSKLTADLTEEQRKKEHFDFKLVGEVFVRRIHADIPTEDEHCFLWTLVLHVLGETSFADVKKVESEFYPTYCEACLRRGLLSDDAELRRALRDAFDSSFKALTELLTMIFAHCELPKTETPFDHFINTSIAHICNRFWSQPLLVDPKFGTTYVLRKFKTRYQQCLNLPCLSFVFEFCRATFRLLLLVYHHKHLNKSTKCQRMNPIIKSLSKTSFQQGSRLVFAESTDQQHGWRRNQNKHSIAASLLPRCDLCHRKMFVTTAIQRFLQSREKCVWVVVPSAATAQLLGGELTAHSALKIPISFTLDSKFNIDADYQLVHDLHGTYLIIWDEIVMTHLHHLEAIDCTFCDLRRSTFPIVGITVLCLGDFRGILPVLRAANHAQTVSAFFNRSQFYRLFQCLRFQDNMHLQALHQGPHATQNSLQFPACLPELGEEKLQSDKKQPAEFPVSVKFVKDVEGWIHQVFPDLVSNFGDKGSIAHRAILTTRNENHYYLNLFIESIIPGPFPTVSGADSIEESEINGLNFFVELFSSTAGTVSLPDHLLSLNEWYIFMILWNLQPKNGHANYSLYIV